MTQQAETRGQQTHYFQPYYPGTKYHTVTTVDVDGKTHFWEVPFEVVEALDARSDPTTVIPLPDEIVSEVEGLVAYRQARGYEPTLGVGDVMAYLVGRGLVADAEDHAEKLSTTVRGALAAQFAKLPIDR